MNKRNHITNRSSGRKKPRRLTQRYLSGVKNMAGYDDLNHEGNSKKYHTGKSCIEGCGRPAGTKWSPYWCFECNVKRINRINSQLKQITKTNKSVRETDNLGTRKESEKIIK